MSPPELDTKRCVTVDTTCKLRSSKMREAYPGEESKTICCQRRMACGKAICDSSTFLATRCLYQRQTSTP